METPWITPGEGQLADSTRFLRVNLPGTPRGAVVVFCSSTELDATASTVLNGLAEHGYESCAVEVGDGAAARPDELVGLSIELLGQRGWLPEQIGVVGYGLAPGLVALAAASSGVGASITVGPEWPSPAELAGSVLAEAARRAEQLTTPWLCLLAAGGAAGEPDVVDQLAGEIVERAPAFVKFVRYPLVTEEFYLGSGRSSVHAAAFDSWQRTVEWLNLRVVPRLTRLAELWRTRLAGTSHGPN
jgi:carboxymethylenebutenolidase